MKLCSQNTFIGYEAGNGSGGAATTKASFNTAVGYRALYAFTSGDQNVAMGREAGANLTTGVQNTFIGTSAGNQSTSQNYNTFIGQLLVMVLMVEMVIMLL